MSSDPTHFPPNYSVASLRQQFLAVAEALERIAAGLRSGVLPEIREIDSQLAQLRAIEANAGFSPEVRSLEALEQSRENLIRLGRIRRAVRIEHCEDPLFPGIEAVRSTVARAEEALQRGTAAQDEEALDALLQLVTDLERLDRATISTLSEQVQEVFGLELLIATIRGELHLIQEEQGEAEPSEATIPDPRLASTSRILAPVSSGEKSWPQTDVEADTLAPSEFFGMHGPDGTAEEVTESLRAASRTTAEPEIPFVHEGALEPPHEHGGSTTPTVRDKVVPAAAETEVVPVGMETAGARAASERQNPPARGLPASAGEETVTVEALSEPPAREDREADDERPAQTDLPPVPDLNANPDLRSIWGSIKEGHLDVAYQLARVTDSTFPPASVLGAHLLGAALVFPAGAIQQACRPWFDELAIWALTEDKEYLPVQLLIAAAALRPGLLSPLTGATTVLRCLRGLEPLMPIFQAVADVGERANGIPSTVISTVQNSTRWEDENKKIREEARRFLAEAHSWKNKYAPATQVWQMWLRPKELLHDLLSPVADGDEARIPALSKALGALDLEREVRVAERRIDETGRMTIQWGGLQALLGHGQEAIRIVRRWLEWHRVRPEPGGYFEQLLISLRHTLDEKRPTLEQIRERLRPRNEQTEIALHVLDGALNSLQALFVGSDEPDTEPEPKTVLDRVYLRTILHLTDSGHPDPLLSTEEVQAAIEQLADHPLSWAEAFHYRLQIGDLQNAWRIVEHLRGVGDQESAEYERKWANALQMEVASIDHDLGETRKDYDFALVHGLLAESRRADFDASLVNVEKHLGGVRAHLRGETSTGTSLRFDDFRRTLAQIRGEVAQLRTERIQDIRSRLNVLRSQISADAVRRIEAALDRADVLTAEEFVTLAPAEGLPPEREETRDSFLEFFPRAVRAITTMFDKEKIGLGAIPDRIRARQAIADLPLHQITQAQAEQAARMVSAWYDLKRRRNIADGIRTVLEAIGFQEVEVKLGTLGTRMEAVIRTQPIANRELIPAAAFGSRARGAYGGLLIWDRPSEEVLCQLAAARERTEPTIVFYFAPISEQQRRDLAVAVRAHSHPFVVLDDTLLLFLAAERGNRLPVFFECALPFAKLDPFVPIGGSLPPEMFFGRRDEYERITSFDDAAILYGGRQLGKTALLRHIEDTYDVPGERVVRYLDLMREGFGSGPQPAELWPILIRTFRTADVFSDRLLRRNASWETVVERLRQWIERQPGRRILLFLDEADEFLRLDAQKNFTETRRLKTLMDETKRHFKVVFAGLNNVIQTWRHPNHPFGQFGNAIEIGPMTDAREIRSASDLVVQPLRMLGYRVESNDLVSRILAQTNYYPSLLQCYGQLLLKLLREMRFDTQSTPPFTVNARHIEDAYRHPELREAIQHRFALTLGLDDRYKVLAYAFAAAVLDGRIPLAQGAAPSILRAEALQYWPEGFFGESSEDVKDLCEIMVRLGVFRRIPPDHYSLRNANVLLLLGTENEIHDRLTSRHRIRSDYEAADFRDAADDEPWRVSPLTARQIGRLTIGDTGVHVIIGSAAMSLDDVPRFLRRRFDEVIELRAGEVAHVEYFAGWLDRLDALPERGTSVVVIPATVGWDLTWTEIAAEHLGRPGFREGEVIFVFLADPVLARRLAEADSRREPASRIGWHSLEPWRDPALAQWLDQLSIPNDPDTMLLIQEVTGGRPWLLARFHQKYIASEGARWEPPLTELHEELQTPDLREAFLTASGLVAVEDREIIRALAAWSDPIHPADLRELVGEPLAQRVNTTLKWAEWLGLVRTRGTDRWEVDPLIAPLVK